MMNKNVRYKLLDVELIMMMIDGEFSLGRWLRTAGNCPRMIP